MAVNSQSPTQRFTQLNGARQGANNLQQGVEEFIVTEYRDIAGEYTHICNVIKSM